MEDNGFARFPVTLDPTAQEFRPSYPPPSSLPILFPLPPPQLLFQYNPPFTSPADPYDSTPQPPQSIPLHLPPPSIPPTRALLLSSVPTDTSESTIRRDLEVFGDVRAVQTERVNEGVVAVHFYDLRAAHAACDQIRHQHMQHQSRLRLFYSRSAYSPPPPPPPPPAAIGLVSGRAVWAQFIIPPVHAFPDGHNQGTLVVFNLDPQIPASSLAHFFENYGPIRELRETPMKRQKFVEFYDVRDAARAISEMNGREIGGKQVVIEFSRPGGGHNKRFLNNPHYSQSRSRTNNNNVKWHPQQPPPSPRPSTTTYSSPPSAKKWFKSVANSNNGGEKNYNNGDGEGNCLSSDSRSVAVVITKPKSKQWKGKGNRCFDPRFLIKEDAIIQPGFRDTRTTVMIKNIPNKYSQKLLLNMLDNHCIHYNEAESQPLSAYDFVYLPIDFNNKCNVGYGFVNMTSPEATLRLYKAFHQQHWEVFNSRKICEVTYARVQGLEALKEHFKNSKFACETEDYLPVVFSPARDGRAHLTDPLPIVPGYHVSDFSQEDDALFLMDGGDSSATASDVPSTSSDHGCDDVKYGVILSGGDEYHHDYDVASSSQSSE